MTEANYQRILGGNLRRLREARGFRQEDVAAFARALGLRTQGPRTQSLKTWTQATVVAIERGYRQVSLGECLLFQSIFNVGLSELLAPDVEFVEVQGARVAAANWALVVSGIPAPLITPAWHEAREGLSTHQT